MDLLPAIDLRDGGAVRLVQGDFDRQQDYGDPLALADELAKGGARWLHVVDLDAARTGEPRHRDLIVAIAERTRVPVQTGGGIRSADDVDELLGRGVARVVMGTVAMQDPGVVHRCAERYPGRVAVGIDYRLRPDGTAEAAVRGWTEGSGRRVDEVLHDLQGAPLGAVVVTAIDRDGTLRGPDTDGLASVLDGSALPVVASGGVGSAEDLRALAGLRGPVSGRALSGAIVGKALVDGRVTLGEAMAACAPSG